MRVYNDYMQKRIQKKAKKRQKWQEVKRNVCIIGNERY